MARIIKIKHLVALLTLTAVMSLQAKNSDTVATVLAKKGDVSITSGTKVTEAKRKASLLELDIIKTTQESKASVKFNDGTVTTLGNNTEMLIKAYDWDKDNKTPSAEFELVQGVFRTVTGLITKVNNPKFVVKTPMGSIGIRGTDFWGGYLDEDAIDVLFVDGEHEIVVTNEFGTTILTKPGQGTTIKAGQAPTAAKTWPQAKVDRAVETIVF
jgi:hypothetical protein